LTGEAGNASRRQVIVGDAGMNPMRDECASDAGRSRPNNSRVMRTNFGDMTAEIFREYSDSLVISLSAIKGTSINSIKTKKLRLIKKSGSIKVVVFIP